MFIKCFPKVNLNLFVTGKNAWYHELDSIFMEVEGDLYDEMSIDVTEGSGIEIICNVDIPENNMIKVYEIMDKRFRLNQKLIIDLKKNIPIGGGLGGGSSNAGNLIKFINRHFKLELSDHQMVNLALEIGSDVPFFVIGGIARVQGNGDEITSLEVKVPKIIIHPNKYSLSTKEVFSKFKMTDCQENNVEETIELLLKGDFKKLVLRNDLREAIFRVDPNYAEFVKSQNLYISGSGSTLFEIGEE